MTNWNEHISKTKNSPPRPWLVKALNYVGKIRENALDLGPGAFMDTKYLIDNGFKRVVAVDSNSVSQDILESIPLDYVQIVESRFEDFDFPENTYDLVNAQFSLPFIEPRSFNRVLNSIKKSLKTDGVFVGQLFGLNDEWNDGTRNMTFHTIEQVQSLMMDMRFLEFLEEEKDRKLATGEIKHWHIFHVIASKEEDLD